MPLNFVNIRPGFNKQITPTAAEGQYIDGDNVRFRYGLPEKIGGWEQLTGETLVGAARAQHQWTDLDGRRYVVIGTHKALILYYSEAFYDITPLDTAITGVTFDTVSGDATVTVNASAHGLEAGDLITFNISSAPTGFVAADFDGTFQVITAPDINTLTIEMNSNSSGTALGSGSASILPYVRPGALNQTFGFGWGTGLWSGSLAGAISSTLNGALLDDANGTGGSGTSITLTSATNFPTTGTILVGGELITYTGKSSNDLTGITRGALGSKRSAHSDGSIVQDATGFIGWGNASSASTVVLPSADWSLDNFGQTLIATILDGRTFTWEPINSNSNAPQTRATVGTGMPTASVMTIVSDQDRHLFHLGTETTIGTTASQDKMFIRFSDQEDKSDYAPTSTNTAGTFQLDDGTEIRGAVKGKDYILILTDTAAYISQFVGPPFTFSIRKVGSNCGLIGKHALVYADGVVYWMADSGGFFVYDGTVKSLPCTVEDFVFTTNNTGDLGIEFDQAKKTYAAYNTLFSEITWFYPKSGANTIDRSVTFNYAENVWTTGSLARTTYYDAQLFDHPYATEFNSTGTPTFPVIKGVTNANGLSTFYEHEKGTDQVNSSGTTAILANIQSGDFQLSLDGDGEFFTKIRRFIPDFKRITGDAQVTINLKDFPVDTAASSPLGPFTISGSTQKIDTRARGRAASLKIENTSTGQSWRYGTFRADVQPDGRR
jgi:hypothetical protein|tara:strand:+ start:1439 stop:3598 length:2160 start_codon:yes stop_codon:yes gene_type:complete